MPYYGKDSEILKVFDKFIFQGKGKIQEENNIM